jgi:hypothetical protein
MTEDPYVPSYLLQLSKEAALRLNKNRRKVDIRDEYFVSGRLRVPGFVV